MSLWNWVQWLLYKLWRQPEYNYADLPEEEQALLPSKEPSKPQKIRLQLSSKNFS